VSDFVAIKGEFQMGEAFFVGPISTSNIKKVDIKTLIDDVLLKWDNAEIKIEEGGEITFSWDVLATNWYLKCMLMQEHTLSIRSNDPTIVADTVIWFYNINLETDLYLYTHNKIINPLKLTDSITEDPVIRWVNS
jgi:hypothetical protein